MRKIFNRIMILSGMAVLLILLSGAVSPFFLPGASVYIEMDGNCGMVSPDDGLVNVPGGYVSVITRNTYGNMTYRCRGEVSNSTGRSARFDSGNTGLPCLIPFNPDAGAYFPTYDWFQWVSSSGSSTLVCTYGRRSLR